MLTTNQLFFLGLWVPSRWTIVDQGPGSHAKCDAVVGREGWTVGPGMKRLSGHLDSHGKSMVAIGHPKILGETHFPNYTSIENDIDYL